MMNCMDCKNPVANPINGYHRDCWEAIQRRNLRGAGDNFGRENLVERSYSALDGKVLVSERSGYRRNVKDVGD